MMIGLCLLAACDQPSQYFRDSDVTRVAVADSTFDVRVRGNIAESIRLNPQYAPRLGPIRGRAALAMHQISGCHVDYVLGDAAVQLGLLNCGPQAPNWAAILGQGTGMYDCMEVDTWLQGTFGDFYSDFDCDPY